MNILSRVRNLELTVKFYDLEEHVFEIFQIETSKQSPLKKSIEKNRCISRGPFEFKTLILLIQNDVIKLNEDELECVLIQIEESINEYIKED